MEYSENAKMRPPSSAGQKRFATHLHRRNIEKALASGHKMLRMLYESTGPNSNVTGAISRLGPGMLVIQARLHPVGAQIAVVRNGLRRFRMACGHHAMAHRKIVGSAPAPM